MVGQQAEQPIDHRDRPSPNPILVEQQNRDGLGVINDLIATETVRRPQVGRYLPADGGRMLDTTNGTLYAVSGDRWLVVIGPIDHEAAVQTVQSERTVLTDAAKFLRHYSFSEASADKAHAIATKLEALLVRLQ